MTHVVLIASYCVNSKLSFIHTAASIWFSEDI